MSGQWAEKTDGPSFVCSLAGHRNFERRRSGSFLFAWTWAVCVASVSEGGQAVIRNSRAQSFVYCFRIAGEKKLHTKYACGVWIAIHTHSTRWCAMWIMVNNELCVSWMYGTWIVSSVLCACILFCVFMLPWTSARLTARTHITHAKCIK